MAFNRPSSNEYQDGNENVSRGTLRLSPIDLFENLFDHRYVFLGIFLGFLLLSVAYAIVSAPVYSADTLIQVEERKASALGSLSEVSKALDIQDSPVLGETDIVRSRTVVTEAINATVAQADVSVKNHIPLVGRFLGSILSRDPNGLVKPWFDSPFWAWGGENLEFKTFDVPDAQIGKKLEFDYLEGNRFALKDSDGREVLTGEVGKAAAHDGYSVDVSQIAARPGTEFRIQRVPTQMRLDAILKKLTVAETKRQSGIMQLTFEDTNPVFAARLVNAIATAYLETNSRRRSEDSERSLAFLNTQLPIVKARLSQAEQALNSFRNKAGSIDAQGDVKLLLDQSALVDKSRLEAKLEYQDLLSKFGPGQPQLVAAMNKFKQLDQQSAELQGKVAQLPSQQQTYLRLARDVEVNNQLYVGLLNNAQQLQIAEAGTVGNASIVDKAEVADKPIRPKWAIVILLGGMFGLVSGFVAAQGLSLFSGRIRDPKRLEAMVGIPTLGILPISPHQIEAGVNKIPTFMISKEQSDTPLVEAMESLALSLQYKLAGKRDESKVILVTSAVPGQGKSMISANLAYLYAEKGLKTLLVDADMRQSTIHRYLPVTGSKGLSGVLQGELRPNQAITRSFEKLHALPAGKHVARVRNLFGSDKLEKLVDSLRGQYDMIIVDSPPVLPVADAAALSKFADVTLFVARQGSVSYAEVVEAVGRLGKVGTQVDGMVFNGFEPSPLRYGYYANAYRYASPSET
jgi:tyrosine-protein kinase Etk/Wzc